jgi:hypothetical protein
MFRQTDFERSKPVRDAVLRAYTTRTLTQPVRDTLLAAHLNGKDPVALRRVAEVGQRLKPDAPVSDAYTAVTEVKNTVKSLCLAGQYADAVQLVWKLQAAHSAERKVAFTDTVGSMMTSFLLKQIEILPLKERPAFVALLAKPLDRAKGLRQLPPKDALPELEKLTVLDTDKPLLTALIADTKLALGDLEGAWRSFDATVDASKFTQADGDYWLRYGSNLGTALALAGREEDAKKVGEWLSPKTRQPGVFLAFDAHRLLVFLAIHLMKSPTSLGNTDSNEPWFPERVLDLLLQANLRPLAWRYCDRLYEQHLAGRTFTPSPQVDRMYSLLMKKLQAKGALTSQDTTALFNLQPRRQRVRLMLTTLSQPLVEKYVPTCPESERPSCWRVLALAQAQAGNATGAKQSLTNAGEPTQDYQRLEVAETMVTLKDYEAAATTLAPVNAPENKDALLRLYALAAGIAPELL